MPAVSVLSGDNHTDFTKADRVVLVAYLDETDTKNRETYEAVAATRRDDYVFGLATDAASIAAAGVKAPALVLYKTFDEGRNDYTGSFTSEGIFQFAQQHSVPLFDEISPSNYAMYAESGLPLAYTFIEATDPSRESLVKSLEPVAKAHQGAINFVWIDALKFAEHAKSLNLLEAKWPAFAIQQVQTMDKFPLDQSKPVDLKSVEAFVKDFAGGKLAASVKSQPVPKIQDEAVYVLVADEFEKITGADKDVFVEFCELPFLHRLASLAPG